MSVQVPSPTIVTFGEASSSGNIWAVVPAGDHVRYALVNGTATLNNGTVTLNDSTGTYTYLGNGYYGLDSFQWVATDTDTGLQSTVETTTLVSVAAVDAVSGFATDNPSITSNDEILIASGTTFGIDSGSLQVIYGDVQANATLTVESSTTLTLTAGGVIEAGGTIDLQGTLAGVGVVTVAGTLMLDGGAIAAGADVLVTGGVSGTNLTVDGILDLDVAGPGGMTLDNVSLVGAGLLINDGMLSLMGNDTIQSIVNHTGATLSLDNVLLDISSIINDGTLYGAGTIHGDVIDVGVLAPNGHIAITGNLALDNGAAVFNLHSSTIYDSLAVSGDLTFTAPSNGGEASLAVTATSGIASGESFALMTWGQQSGTFGAMTGMADTTDHLVLDPVYSNTGLTLHTETASSLGTGDYQLAANGGSTMTETTSHTVNEVLIGQVGNDTISIHSTAFDLIDGGGGFNTLNWTGGTSLDLTQLGKTPTQATQLIENIQAIDLSQAANSTALTLDLAHLLQMTAGGNPATTPLFGGQPSLLVIGNSTDTLNLAGGGWHQDTTTPTAANLPVPNHTTDSYSVYSNGNAHVLVDGITHVNHS